MDRINWAENQPSNYPSFDCAFYRNTSRHFEDGLCSLQSCPVCQLSSIQQNFMLRGVCLHSAVDSLFMMESSSLLVGYIQSKMMFSVGDSRWEIVNSTNTSHLLAFMLEDGENNFPLGLHRWMILDTDCSDPGVEYRSLSLHLEVDQPGHFCCDDGTCISSQRVCNNFPDCFGREDEVNCTFLHSTYHEDRERPPVQLENGQIEDLLLNATFDVLEVFEINEVDSFFDVYFILEVEWFAKNFNFEFLKYESFYNGLNESAKKRIWTPRIEFSDTNVKKIVTCDEYEVIILRRGKPKLDADIDLIQANEIYHGTENPLKISIEERIKFSCSFDNIKNFPFGKQKCSLKLHVTGVANRLTEINPRNCKIRDRAASVVGQYVIDSWTIENYFDNQIERHVTRVTMVLSRKIVSIIMVTYLPTLLINLINQATNYIPGNNKFEMIYTINITCMMVLASIYLSVSASLPTTSDIKPVEVWLLFNLAYPFIIILVNILLQVTR